MSSLKERYKSIIMYYFVNGHGFFKIFLYNWMSVKESIHIKISKNGKYIFKKSYKSIKIINSINIKFDIYDAQVQRIAAISSRLQSLLLYSLFLHSLCFLCFVVHLVSHKQGESLTTTAPYFSVTQSSSSASFWISYEPKSRRLSVSSEP